MTLNAGMDFLFTINGRLLPIFGFDATSGAFGSVGHASIYTSGAMLQTSGIDPFQICSTADGPVEINLSQVMDGVVGTKFFGGEHVHTNWNYDNDIIEFHCRDWAGQLVDQKRVLSSVAKGISSVLKPLLPGQNPSAAGISGENQTVSKIVTAIANEFNMTPVLNLSGSSSSLIGQGTDTDRTFLTVPQSLWAILNQLARRSGNVVYVTPNRELVFGEPGVGVDPLLVCWGLNPAPDGNLPCRNLSVEHHPRRNATFRVMVMSYDPNTTQTTLGQAVNVGANFAGTKGLKPGIWTGSDANTASKQIAQIGKGGGATQIPLYTFHLDGLTQSGAQARAASIAADIAKRELILDLAMDGFPEATPTQKLTLSIPAPGTTNPSTEINPAFPGMQFYVNSYHHTFKHPKVQRHHAGPMMGHLDGFFTRIRALDIPTRGTGGGGNSEGPNI